MSPFISLSRCSGRFFCRFKVLKWLFSFPYVDDGRCGAVLVDGDSFLEHDILVRMVKPNSKKQQKKTFTFFLSIFVFVNSFNFLSLIFCKGNANRTQRKLVFYVEMQLILCKDNANRTQRKLVFYVEMRLILCKDNIKNPFSRDFI